MPRPRKWKPPIPTWTSLTLEALRRADDFLSLDQLKSLTAGTSGQVTAALHSLQNYGAVEAVEVNGKPFWFATGADRRSRHLEKRVPEEPGTRKPRRNVSTKVKGQEQ